MRRGSAPYLQSYIVPVCVFREEPSGINIKAHVGTAFFATRTGIFVTARHVIEGATTLAAARSAEFGLVTKRNHGTSPDNQIWHGFPYEFAPRPFDIAVGLLDYHPDTPLRLGRADVSVWQEIASLGYPLSATAPAGDGLWLPERVHRGYIQRVTIPDHMPFGEHPPGFELSFLLDRGASGAPIFTVPGEVVIGVGVGSYTSEEMDDELLEVLDNGTEYRERRVKLHQFGYAHDIRPLMDWRPALLGGKTLFDAHA